MLGYDVKLKELAVKVGIDCNRLSVLRHSYFTGITWTF